MSSLVRIVIGALLLFVAFFLFWQLQLWSFYIIVEFFFYPIQGRVINGILLGVDLALATVLSAWECWLIVRWRRKRNRSHGRRGIFGPKPPADDRGAASQVSS